MGFQVEFIVWPCKLLWELLHLLCVANYVLLEDKKPEIIQIFPRLLNACFACYLADYRTKCFIIHNMLPIFLANIIFH